ncbi:bifunctional UDP-N-acetylglucosamine diphosphorylase/glucosamine-1-phosphate N-acetyltransferase GlmU [Zhongshania aliphaticivorans]|uniref:bifunctional UDP-N-acetylglucosamine diphosphorylase/glucosamine-1-phosphate N-acetyltransferase GlmU n=1 Tax=Zhongshania aliphaticivorans TaxID=1470434 RepID=UPI0039C91414
MTLEVIILAAGQGSRMRSTLPKVLHPVAGKSMLSHVIDLAAAVASDKTHVVIGHGADQVKSSIPNSTVQWALQSEQKGTGHAVAQALPAVSDDAQVLILYGDVPLTTPETIQKLVSTSANKANTEQVTLLTVELGDPNGYGRIIRNNSHQVTAIVEQKDASVAQLSISEVNTGIMCVSASALKRWLPKLSDNNAQGEYYLTDIIAMAVSDGVAIHVCQATEPMEVQGANNRIQLEELERFYQRRYADKLMLAGASLADASRIDVRGSLTTGNDVYIDINCVFEGDVILGDGVRIGPNCHISDSKIASNAEIKTNSVLEGAVVGADCSVGPFARLRPGTILAAEVKIGNFVETKKANIGFGSKVSHLSYIGDAEIGRDVNVGAGTITCNYDGVNKYKTTLADEVFVGSNTALVAPVSVGKAATIGAGSVITGNIADGELAVARSKQRNISGWQRPKKLARD